MTSSLMCSTIFFWFQVALSSHFEGVTPPNLALLSDVCTDIRSVGHHYLFIDIDIYIAYTVYICLCILSVYIYLYICIHIYIYIYTLLHNFIFLLPCYFGLSSLSLTISEELRPPIWHYSVTYGCTDGRTDGRAPLFFYRNRYIYIYILYIYTYIYIYIYIYIFL